MTPATLIDRAFRLLGLVEITTAATATVSATTLITRALKALNVFEATETPPAEDLADGLVSLNTMVGAWPGGVAQFATLATTQTLSTILIRAIPLNLAIEVASAYGATPTATLVATSQQAMIDVRRRAVRDGGLTVVTDLLDTWDTEAHGLHQTASSLTTDLVLPVGYAQALSYQLAVAFAPLVNVDPRPDVLAEATRSLAALRRAAIDMPVRTCDAGLPGMGPGRWDIETGTYR